MTREECIKVLTSGDLDKAASAMKEILSTEEFAWGENYGWRTISFDSAIKVLQDAIKAGIEGPVAFKWNVMAIRMH